MSQGSRFCDVILIARDVIDEIEKTGALTFPIDVRGSILPVTAQRLSPQEELFAVRTSRRDWRTNQFYSALFRYLKHADIIYSAELILCWKRLSVFKEAAHLLIDDKDTHCTTDVVGLIQRLITSAPMVEADTLLESEVMGIVAAIELLIPWKLRKELEGMCQAGKTDFEIAEYCRVPEKFVNLMLRSPYGATSKRVNEQLDGEMKAD